MMTRHVPQAAAKRTMRGVIFTVLISGQRHKHENELRRLGFDVESRDFPKSYNFDAYDVIFIVQDHSPVNDCELAERAAKASGKPWFRITKKTSNPTWQAVAEYSRKSALTPVEDTDSHEPSLSAKPFADIALSEGGFEQYALKKADADSWAALASEYEQQAQTCAAQTKAALARVEEIEVLWKQSEADLKEMRKRLQTATEDAIATAAQREALRADVERLQKELTALTTAKAVGRKAVERVDTDVQQRLRDTDALMRQARDERDAVKAELATVKKEAAEAKRVVAGLQDTIEELTKQLAAKPPMMPSTVVAAEIPAGKRLVPANIEQTAEKLWSLFEDGVMDIEEVWAKLMTQLKGGNDD